jgi:hypothetical protein
VGSEEKLLMELDNRSLAARRAEADAVSGRVANALKRAAQLLEPKVQFVAVDKATLRKEADIIQWLEVQEKKLSAALKNGPVQIQ